MSEAGGMVSPSWTLDEAFEPGLVCNPVPCFREPGWIPVHRDVLDGVTGRLVAVAGDYPLICHRAVSTPAILGLLLDNLVPGTAAERGLE